MCLSHTHDEPAPYKVVALVTPPSPEQLDLVALHARLLPLAQQAGHERLSLTLEVGLGPAPRYQAYGCLGAADFHTYVLASRPEACAADFARVLEERLQRAADAFTGNCCQL
ncbi:hypothetical protein HHL22_20750 [Hymenobacter sp. RP-2-7]|uniref:Uncharacterized protein n=1 Tax=Hymenobacter polaris TaxID=2682546 RepID=A0A7Y0AHU7_9BACT|nr:hypothetical protein [Hymenobacter polaris]NML67638.1 hypothetical protein [Hymenobacter polaris]